MNTKISHLRRLSKPRKFHRGQQSLLFTTAFILSIAGSLGASSLSAQQLPHYRKIALHKIMIRPSIVENNDGDVVLVGSRTNAEGENLLVRYNATRGTISTTSSQTSDGQLVYLGINSNEQILSSAMQTINGFPTIRHGIVESSNFSPLPVPAPFGSFWGSDINASGWVAGLASLNGNSVATISSVAGAADLNTMLLNGSGWSLTNADMINDSGQIVATGRKNGRFGQALLTPVAIGLYSITDLSAPSPATFIVRDLNATGAIVGDFFTPNGSSGVVLSTGGATGGLIPALDGQNTTPSYPKALSDTGVVVGNSGIPESQKTAFIFDIQSHELAALHSRLLNDLHPGILTDAIEITQTNKAIIARIDSPTVNCNGEPQCEYLLLKSTARCVMDTDENGTLELGDLFGFLSRYFSQDPRADLSYDGIVAVQDIFDFLEGYFAPESLGCNG